MKINTSQQNIPSGWKLKKLSDVLEYERPDAYIVKSTSYSDKAKTPVLTANKSFILGCTDEDFGIYENVPAIIFDDFTTDSKFVDFPFKIKSSAIKILKNKNADIDLRFVFEKMKSVNFPTGSHKRFYISQYQNLEIALPPIKEQQKIAEILGTVDEDITKTQEVIEATEKLKRGLMQQLFTRGIGHTKFKETKIGQIPEEWDVLELGKVCNIESGSTPKTEKTEYWDGEIVWITPFDLSRLESRYIETSSRKITEAGLQNSSAIIVPEGSLVMSSRAPIGYLAINKVDCATNQGCKSFTPKKENNVEFLYYYLDLNISRIKKLGAGSTFAEVGRKALETLLVAVPSPAEQKEIAEILSAVDEKISINNKLKEKLIILKKGLRQDLLSGTVGTNI